MTIRPSHWACAACASAFLLLSACLSACAGGGSSPSSDAGPDAADGADDGSDAPPDCQPGFFGSDCAPCTCLGAAVCDDGRDGSGACSCPGSYGWTVHPDNPVIRWQDFLPDTFWNDPSVLREDDGWTMWLSGGDPNADPIRVSVYRARSADGLSWTLDPAPVLEPGQAGDFDSARIETPDVIRVGDTYHLYYSGCGAGCDTDPVFAIGHATSEDGVHWQKDPANPVVRRQDDQPQAWGAVGANEPAVFYHPDEERFYLYYVGVKFDDQDPTIGHIGVLLATSEDGSHFTHLTDEDGLRRVVLTRDIPGAPSGAWFGYGSPGALRTAGGKIHLFAGFIVAPGGPATAQSAAIAHAVSDDGLDFEVIDEALLEAGQGDWLDQNVRAATAVEEDGGLKLWFAGDTLTPVFSEGIGFASAVCQ